MNGRPTAILKNWEVNGARMSGNVYGHWRFADDWYIDTSTIVSVAETEGYKLVATKNTDYIVKADEMHPDIAKFYQGTLEDYYKILLPVTVENFDFTLEWIENYLINLEEEREKFLKSTIKEEYKPFRMSVDKIEQCLKIGIFTAQESEAIKILNDRPESEIDDFFNSLANEGKDLIKNAEKNHAIFMVANSPMAFGGDIYYHADHNHYVNKLRLFAIQEKYDKV